MDYLQHMRNAKERARTPAKTYVPGSVLKSRNLNAKTPKSAKRPHGAGGGSSVKKVHGNTFCTPSKIRKLDYGKLNSTVAPVPVKKPAQEFQIPAPPPGVVVVPPTKAALQNAERQMAAMMPPPPPAAFPRFSDMMEKDFECIPADSRSSIFSLNLSSSTSVDQPVACSSSVATTSTTSQNSSFSPIVKKCMETFEATIEQKLAQMFEKMQNIQQPAVPARAIPSISVIPATPAASDAYSQPDSSDQVKPVAIEGAPAIPWDIIRREIQEAIRCEMSTINDSQVPKFESTPRQMTQSQRKAPVGTGIRNPALQRLKDQAKASAANDSVDELDGTVVMNTKTPRRWEVINVDSDEEEADESGVVVRRRVSKRLSGSRRAFDGIDPNASLIHPAVAKSSKPTTIDESYLWEVNDGQVRRRSTRISMRKSMGGGHKHKKGCCPSTKKKPRFETLAEEDEKENAEPVMRRKAVTMTISNKVIASYFQTPSAAGSKKGAKKVASEHGKAVLDLVNRGTIKEVQILPTVGLKMSYQIVTHRTINGKFKKIEDLSKLFAGGKKWTKFLEANYLS
ncbi:kinesin-like protein KIF22 [Uranotaenia lowii]|uniref:kinesin-like protein KIF22 n=1 Tax=Uranotaenia lowii TaxID=190385 RepID=UPI00247B1CE3|nr:kinesin-like protein KIF22 [Uranotaenia lowii]